MHDPGSPNIVGVPWAATVGRFRRMARVAELGVALVTAMKVLSRMLGSSASCVASSAASGIVEPPYCPSSAAGDPPENGMGFPPPQAESAAAPPMTIKERRSSTCTSTLARTLAITQLHLAKIVLSRASNPPRSRVLLRVFGVAPPRDRRSLLNLQYFRTARR